MSNNLVKILIKAPNQLVDDQTVHCERNWTIKKLKHHLANVYPCKPHPDGQKLIYSGQLLSDEAVLSDILRSYDGQENNTIHLVCSMREAYKINRLASKPAPPPREPIPSSGENNNNWNAERAREQNSLPRMPGPMVLPNVNTTPQNMMQQSLWFQQAYFNYMTHYSQMYMMANNQYGTNAVNNLSIHFPNINDMNTNVPQPANEENREVREIPAQLDRNENEVEDGQEDGRANRDWLEWFYMGSRFFVLFTLVYFYSSPERFIMVVVMALILINIDVFRWRRVHQNPPAPGESGAANDDASSPDTPQTENPVVPMNWLHVTWSFMKTFFLSLVPDNHDI